MAVLLEPQFARGILNELEIEPFQSIYESSATQNFMLGTKLEFADGRVFRYAKAGGVALVQARMNQSGVTSATYFTAIPQTGYAQVVGDRDIRVLVTTGGIAGTTVGYTENGFSGGWLVCNKVSPAVLGDIYGIVASKYVDETHMDLKLATPWRNAMLATGEVTLTVSKFFGSTVFAAYDATAPANGVALCPVPIGYFYWSQVKGPAPLIVDGSETYDIGCMIGCPITLGTAGDGGPLITTTAEVLRQPWGVCMSIATDGEPGLVDLCLE
jgi:hypothetical protein